MGRPVFFLCLCLLLYDVLLGSFAEALHHFLSGVGEIAIFSPILHHILHHPSHHFGDRSRGDSYKDPSREGTQQGRQHIFLSLRVCSHLNLSREISLRKSYITSLPDFMCQMSCSDREAGKYNDPQ